MSGRHVTIFPGARRLPPAFFARDTLLTARDLIGMLLVNADRNGLTAGIVVETEAYAGRTDPGSHAFRGRRKRNAPMFGPPGRAYVYKCHMHPLLNVVTERDGTPGAVLLRSIQPVAGIDLMLKRRGRMPVKDLARGPGRLTSALGVHLAHNRRDLTRGRLALIRPPAPTPINVARTTRIGLSGAASLKRWRFFAAGNPFVSHV